MIQKNSDPTGDVLTPVMGLLLGRPCDGWQEMLTRALERYGWENFEAVLWENRISLRSALALREHFPDFGNGALDLIVAQQEQRVKEYRQYMSLLEDVLQVLDFVFIKTVDNFPDFGHDVDILTRDGGGVVRQVFLSRRFRMGKQTLAERIADKMNFRYRDFCNAEAHCGVIGEFGEHREMTYYILENKQRETFNGELVWVPDYPSRIMLMVLQRMYRHFNVRACDVLNAINWIREGALNIPETYEVSKRFGILPGTRMFFGFVNEVYSFYYHNKIVETEPIAEELYCHRKLYRFQRVKVLPIMYGRKAIWSLANAKWESLARELLVVPIAGLAFADLLTLKKGRVW